MKNEKLYLLFATILTLSMVLAACGVENESSPGQNWATAAPMPKPKQQAISTPAPTAAADQNSDHKSYYNIRPYGQEYSSDWVNSPEWVEKKDEFFNGSSDTIGCKNDPRELPEGVTCEKLWEDYLATIN